MSTNNSQSKNRKRKYRYTFPNELDEHYDSPVKNKRRHSTPIVTDDFLSYDEEHIIITKTSDCIKKERIVKKYTKVHPEPCLEVEPQMDSNENGEQLSIAKNSFASLSEAYAKGVRGFCKRGGGEFPKGTRRKNDSRKILTVLSKVVVKIIYYIGLLSFIAI
jgi:hypothetical protein